MGGEMCACAQRRTCDMGAPMLWADGKVCGLRNSPPRWPIVILHRVSGRDQDWTTRGITFLEFAPLGTGRAGDDAREVVSIVPRERSRAAGIHRDRIIIRKRAGSCPISN